MLPYDSDTVQLDRIDLPRRLLDLPRIPLGHYPTPVEEMTRLREALGGGPRLLIKRDDAISFGCGGNKVRKLELVAAEAAAAGADTLITSGGIQSNHARVTAAAAARLGMKCVLVLNGTPPPLRPTGNALLMELFGAQVDYVCDRAQRSPRMHAIAAELTTQGRRPFVIPLGASTALGTLGFFRAVHELFSQIDPPDTIVVASSSGGTQAGICGGCLLFGAPTRVIGVSADDAADEIARLSSRLCAEAIALLGADGPPALQALEVDDTFVGAGYGQATDASRQAADLLARTEGLVVDPVYTAKALACLIAYVRQGRFSDDQTVLFWHTGGIPGLFA
jgi:D-cysteine desulfhydrase family pyridoxal phosphate-dependent enzyme